MRYYCELHRLVFHPVFARRWVGVEREEYKASWIAHAHKFENVECPGNRSSQMTAILFPVNLSKSRRFIF